MIQSLFQTIENTAFNEWFLTSMWGFPTFIALHSVGMAFVVGLSLVVVLRYFGIGSNLDQSVMPLLFKVAWLGFSLNLVTGIALLSSRISEYIVDPTFLIKMALIVFAATGLRALHYDLHGLTKLPSLSRRTIAAATLVFWFGAITAGRWIAYLSGVYA